MAEFLKNNPNALRHLILYQFLQQNTFKEAFHDFCETVGPGVINKKEFQLWFDRLGLGKFNHKKELADMREVLRNDKQALRACVMYEWLSTKSMELGNGALSPFTEYKNFCKVIGDNVMGYREFEFWFYRFENGMFDLKFERDKDEKILELSDMPIDIMKNVVEYLNIFDRVSLAKTSRSIKTFVEDQKSFSKKLEFGFDRRTAWVHFENRKIDITRRVDKCHRSSVNENSQNRRLIEGVSHWKHAIQDFESILKYPKLHLEEFSLELYIPSDFDTPMDGELEEIVEATHALEAAFEPIQQLHVKKLWLNAYNMNPHLNILPFIKPGYLSTIEIRIHKLEGDKMKEVVELEQWKQAKYFTMGGFYYENDLYIVPLCHFYHAKTFDVILKQCSVEEIREMKEILYNSSNFEKCTIDLINRFDMNVIRNEFGVAIQEDPDIYHYPISNSKEFFEIIGNGWRISITRKQK